MIYLVSGYALLGLLCLGAFSWAAGAALLRALWRHLASPPTRKSGLGSRWERHQSARLGFTTSTRAK